MDDNRHGMLLWADHDRCLYGYWASLQALNLDGIVVDVRQYERSCVKKYLLVTGTYSINRCKVTRRRYKHHKDVLNRWQDSHPRPLKPGFFLANNTDAAFRQQVKTRQKPHIGKVLDVIKGDSIVVELTIDVPQQWHIISYANAEW